jgi:hypothetical protein
MELKEFKAEAPRGEISDSRLWPDPEKIKPHNYSSSFIPKKLSGDLAQARTTIEKLKEIHERALAQDVERYNALRFTGVQAVSQYDLNYCYQGNAAKALHNALQLKFNHITYQNSHIAEFNDYLNGQLDGHQIQLGFF